MNFLLLDEPANHLDRASRQVLQEALKSFEGTLVVAIHDRPFLDAVAAEAYVLDGGILQEERLSLAASTKKR